MDTTSTPRENSEAPRPIKQLTPLEAAAGVRHPPEPKKFPKPNVDIEALRRAIHESLKKKEGGGGTE